MPEANDHISLPSQQLENDLRSAFDQTLKQLSIDAEPQLITNFSKYYLPLAAWIAGQHQKIPLVIGINGAQGSGKSSLSRILSSLLEQGFNKKVVILSIDDLYKTRQQRQKMAESVHPLFKTRGVPGTHDVQLGVDVLQQLKQQKAVKIPAFDKSIDDLITEKNWIISSHDTDIVLFEGWCVGSTAEHESALEPALNPLEEKEDADGKWRSLVNKNLATDYLPLFALIDKLIMLKIPDFNKVFEWRHLQEEKLKKQTEANSSRLTMNRSELDRFIMHFERITRHTLNEMSSRADVILEIDKNHQIQQTIFKDLTK